MSSSYLCVICECYPQLRMDTLAEEDCTDARQALKKINAAEPGLASKKEILDLDHSLTISVKWGLEKFLSRSHLGFGLTNERVWPENPGERPGMLAITDMHRPIGNAVGWASSHFRFDSIYDPVHRLHDNALNGLKRCGGWQVGSLALLVAKCWRGYIIMLTPRSSSSSASSST